MRHRLDAQGQRYGKVGVPLLRWLKQPGSQLSGCPARALLYKVAGACDSALTAKMLDTHSSDAVLQVIDYKVSELRVLELLEGLCR
jgi:hypothetical protein